jgi:hypothetical protein
MMTHSILICLIYALFNLQIFFSSPLYQRLYQCSNSMYSNSNGDVNAPDTKADVPKVLDILVSNQLLNGSKLTYLKQKKRKGYF